MVHLGTKILRSALEQLKLAHADIKPQNVILREGGISPFDGRITLKTNTESFQYLLEIKAHPRPETIRHLIVLRDTDKGAKNIPILVVADYLTPNLAAKLREAGINYLDAAGNLFLKRAPNLYMQVEGKKPPSPVAGLKTRLFQPSGLALLFVTQHEACLSHRRRVDDGEHLDEVVCDQAIEERLIPIQQGLQKDVLLDVICFAGIHLVAALALGLDIRDGSTKKTAQAQVESFFLGKGGSFVEKGVTQELSSAKVNFKIFLIGQWINLD